MNYGYHSRIKLQTGSGTVSETLMYLTLSKEYKDKGENEKANQCLKKANLVDIVTSGGMKKFL